MTTNLVYTAWANPLDLFQSVPSRGDRGYQAIVVHVAVPRLFLDEGGLGYVSGIFIF